MGRDDGFSIADISTVHFDDTKVRKLWRRIGDSSAMCQAMTIHLSVVLASWGAGRRVSVEEAAPLWLAIDPGTLDNLVAVGLLDRQHRVPRRSWDDWYGPAFARREERRETGRRGGLAKAAKAPPKLDPSSARGELYPTGRQAGPYKPSVQTEPSVARAPAGGGAAGGARNLSEALEGTPLGESIAARRSGR